MNIMEVIQMTDNLIGYVTVTMQDGSKRHVCKYCIGIAWNTNNEEDMKSHITTHQVLVN